MKHKLLAVLLLLILLSGCSKSLINEGYGFKVYRDLDQACSDAIDVVYETQDYLYYFSCLEAYKYEFTKEGESYSIDDVLTQELLSIEQVYELLQGHLIKVSVMEYQSYSPYTVDCTFSLMDVVYYEELEIIEYQVIEERHVQGEFYITKFEILTTGFGEFPYNSIFRTTEQFEIEEMVEVILSELSAHPETITSVGPITGPKAKLIITLQNDTETIQIEGYQDSTNQISGLRLSYEHINGDHQIMVYTPIDNSILISMNMHIQYFLGAIQ